MVGPCSTSKTPSLVLSFLLTSLICLSLPGLVGCALTPCTRVDDCSCKVKDKEINIRSLGYQGTKAPRFGYKAPKTPGTPWEFAYNPCYPFTDKGECTKAIACQRSAAHHEQTYDLGDAKAEWKDDGTNYYIEYSHTDSKKTTRISHVTLKCDSSAKQPTLERDGEDPGKTNLFNFILTTECACPGTCKSAPPNPSSSGLSAGSIICIVFAVLVVVYLVGGMLFMKFVRHADGVDIVPNHEVWFDLPGNIKEGFSFVFSFCRRDGGSK